MLWREKDSPLNGVNLNINKWINPEDSDENQIADFIASQFDLVRIPPGKVNNLKPIDCLTHNFIIENRIIPFSIENNKINVAISDPLALEKINNVELMTNKKAEAFVITISESKILLGNILKKQETSKTGHAKNEDKIIEVVNSEVINFVNKILNEGVKIGASDIHLEPFSNLISLRYRIDGSLKPHRFDQKFAYENYQAIAARFKIIASLNISEKRLPQDGGFSLREIGNNVYFRISILPTCFGERIVLRILNQDNNNWPIDQIGFTKKDLSNFKKAINSPQGMVLVTGPTGSGKTTTLYSAINHIKSAGTNILTVEDPIECYIEGVNQVSLNENIGLNFPEILKSFLRQDPEVLLIGEIRDKKTVDMAVKASLTGHLVLSTLHTNDAPSTITRLRNMEIPNYLIAASVNCIVAQRLAKKICDSCKVIDELFLKNKNDYSETFKIQNIDESYIGSGCDACMGTGIQGRQAIYEVLNLDESLRDAIIKDSPKSKIVASAKEKGFVEMHQIGLSYLQSGLISAEEYFRVLSLN